MGGPHRRIPPKTCLRPPPVLSPWEDARPESACVLDGAAATQASDEAAFLYVQLDLPPGFTGSSRILSLRSYSWGFRL